MLLTLANTITADMGLIPGLAFVGPAMGLPLSVLASFIERPFYSRGGVSSHAIWHSLQANFLSLIIGFVILIAYGCLMSAVGLQASDAAFFLVWPVLAVCCSVVIERVYIAGKVDSEHVSWGWSAAGNIVSAGTCIAVLFCVITVREHFPSLAPALRPYALLLTVVAGAGSCVVFAAAFFATGRRVAKDV